MAVDREDLLAVLRRHSPEDLAEVLGAAGISASPGDGAERLAARFVSALWWRTHTPAGLLWPSTLDGLVDELADRARLDLGDGDVWSRLQRLSALVGEAPDPTLAARIAPGLPWGSIAGTTGAGAAAGVRQASLWALRLTSGEIGRWLPLIPKVGPVYLVIRQGVKTAARVSAPVGVALALASINGVMGADYGRALPLLVGLGSLSVRLSPDA